MYRQVNQQDSMPVRTRGKVIDARVENLATSLVAKLGVFFRRIGIVKHLNGRGQSINVGIVNSDHVSDARLLTQTDDRVFGNALDQFVVLAFSIPIRQNHTPNNQ